MIREAQLVFQHYVPEDDYSKLMFLTVNSVGTPYVYVLNGLNKVGAEGHISMNGYPVKPFIIDPGNPNIPNSQEVLATPEQIGWFDEGDDCDELCDIEFKHINIILDNYTGWVNIEVDEDGEPILFMDKVTISYADDIEEDDEWDDDDDDENIQDWDDDDYKAIF